MQNAGQSLGRAHPSADPGDQGARRACDQCRLRKIRCDKDWPCSNCRTANRSCTSTGAGQRPKEPRQRVLISSQYERKIDQIESRLGNIESLLKSLSTSHVNPPDRARQVHTPGSNIPTAAASTVDADSSDEESAFGGDSGFTSQTAFASDFIEHAVQRTSLHDVNPGMEAALANLRQLVEMQKRRSISHGPRFPLQKPMPPGGLSQLPMPPMEVVVSLLKQTKVGVTDFSSLCRMVYFPADDFSQATFAIVNNGLHNLFMEELSLSPDAAKRDEYQAYAELARANLETYLANIPLFLSAKVENVQALLLGAQYAVDVCRPSVAWHLNAMAAQLCQTAGFHRAEVIGSDPPRVGQIKAILFWHVYIWDKGLGLRLGRASTIRDCDITIARAFDFSGFPHLEMSVSPQLWLRLGIVQGRIYEELFSPAAIEAPPSELARRARELAVECRNIEQQVTHTRDETFAYLKSINSSTLVDIFVKGDEVQSLVTLTLVYRAIPAPEGSASRFCIECLDTARKTMKAHQESARLLHYGSYINSIYVHWNLMLTPFAPFFILFCHVIETLSAEDLTIIQDFVASIERLRDASETIEKLFRVFQVYRDVAVMYVEAKSQQSQDQTMIPIGDEFDMYLSQLGFMPAEDQPMDASGLSSTSHLMQAGASGQTWQMADWFSGSRSMFGLLEEDLSQIDASRWMAPGSAP